MGSKISKANEWRGGEISLTQISTPDGPNGPISITLADDEGALLFEAMIAPENYAAFDLRNVAVDCTYQKRELEST